MGQWGAGSVCVTGRRHERDASRLCPEGGRTRLGTLVEAEGSQVGQGSEQSLSEIEP